MRMEFEWKGDSRNGQVVALAAGKGNIAVCYWSLDSYMVYVSVAWDIQLAFEETHFALRYRTPVAGNQADQDVVSLLEEILGRA
jgi:hypothetical protein